MSNADRGRVAVGRVKARQGRTPAQFAPGRKKRLQLGREAAEDLIKGTMAKNQTTDTNNE